MFTICFFENGKGDADAIEEIGELNELTIDTISSELQIIRLRTAAGEIITREINPLKISLYIDEGDIL